MHIPLLIPDCVQSLCSHGGNGGSEVGRSEGAKTVFCFGANIRVAGIQRRGSQPGKDEKGGEITLEQDVDVGIGGEIPTVAAVAQLRIDLVAQTGVHTILNVEPGGEVGAV